MSAPSLCLDKGVTRRERLVLFAACVACDPETGEVSGGKHTIGKLTDIADRKHLRETLRLLENRGLIRRIRTRLFVVLGRLSPPPPSGRCEGCQEPLPASVRGAQRWCESCRQVLGRKDRAWQPKAITLLVEGKSPPEIALAVRRPLWRSSVEDDNQATAVVPFLLREGLLGEEWREWLRRATEGGAD